MGVTTRRRNGVVVLIVVGVLASSLVSAAPLEPRVTAATLYMQQIAELTAEVTVTGGQDAVFGLPGTLLKDSLEVRGADDVPINASLLPIKGTPSTPLTEPPIEQYRCTVSGLPAGEHTLKLRYLVTGLGWMPNYELKLHQDGTGTLTVGLIIKNEACALRNTQLKLMSGVFQGEGLSIYGGSTFAMAEGAFGPLGDAIDRGLLKYLGDVGSELSGSSSVYKIKELANQTIEEGQTLRMAGKRVLVELNPRYVWIASVDEQYGWMTSLDEDDLAGEVIAVYSFINVADEPISRGKIQVRSQDAVLGYGLVGFARPGEEATLVFRGTDKIVVNKTTQDTPIAETWEVKHGIALSVANKDEVAANVRVLEASPSSSYYAWNSDYEEVTPWFESNPDKIEDGMVTWNLTVPARETKELKYEYTTPLNTTNLTVVSLTCTGKVDEQNHIYEDTGTMFTENGWRYVSHIGRVTYALSVPAGVTEADLWLRLAYNATVSLAADDGGRPTEFKPVIDIVGMLGSPHHKYRAADYCVNISSYLKTGRTVYVRVENGGPSEEYRSGIYSLTLLRIPEGYESRGRLYLGSEPSGLLYKWYELENWGSGQGWGHSDFWAPSGGRFLYPLPGAQPLNIRLALRPSGEWVVWVRARDETRGMRQGTATVNGKESYIMGGADSFQWIWYHVGFAEGTSVKLALARIVRDLHMDEWFDCLLLTNDLSFVPPGRYTNPTGYTAYNAAEDLEKGYRPAWIWWPTQPQPGTVGYYRKTFELDDVPSNAELSMGAIGPYVVYLNGQEVAEGSNVGELSDYDVTELCQQGPNVIAVQVEHAGFLPGLRIHLRAELPGGSEADIVSDLTWKSTDAVVDGWLKQDFDDTSWHRPWARIGERHSVGY